MTTHYVLEIKGLKTRGRFKPLIYTITNTLDAVDPITD